MKPLPEAGLARGTPSWAKTVAFSLIPVIVLLLLAEGGLRVYSWYFRTAYERYNPATERLELVPGFQSTLPGGRRIRINSKGFAGPEFDAAKPAGIQRIFAVGDSCTFAGDWDVSYSVFLERLLNADGRKFEVINAGIEGYDSAFALGRIRDDVLKYAPDLVTIYVGWNDLMKTRPGSVSSGGRVSWLGAALSRSYLFKGLSKLVYFYLRPMLAAPAASGAEPEYHAFDGFVSADYEDNLSAMVALLRERGVHVLLMTRPTVLRRGMIAADLKAENVFFPYYAEAYSVPRLLSLHNSYNASVRRVAERLRVPVVDLDEEFNRRDKRALFWDTMHPSKRGHELIAATLAPRVREVLAAQ
jgi:lysophospholipase L1-like esterase